MWVSRKLRPETREKTETIGCLNNSDSYKSQTVGRLESSDPGCNTYTYPMQSPVATQRIYLFILFVTNNYEENEKFNSQDIYFIATRELSLITMQASRCDRERSPRPSPRNRHERAAEIEPARLHLVGKMIGTGSTGLDVQEAEEQSHNSTYIQHKLTWRKGRSLGTRQNCFVLLPCSRVASLSLSFLIS